MYISRPSLMKPNYFIIIVSDTSLMVPLILFTPLQSKYHCPHLFESRRHVKSEGCYHYSSIPLQDRMP